MSVSSADMHRDHRSRLPSGLCDFPLIHMRTAAAHKEACDVYREAGIRPEILDIGDEEEDDEQ